MKPVDQNVSKFWITGFKFYDVDSHSSNKLLDLNLGISAYNSLEVDESKLAHYYREALRYKEDPKMKIFLGKIEASLEKQKQAIGS